MKIFAADKILSDEDFIEGHGILVNGGRVEEVAPLPALLGRGELIHYGEAAIIPGTVNAHNHSFQSLVRGFCDDMSFFDWRDKGIYRFSLGLGTEECRVGALFAFGEMLRNGVTTVADFFYLHDEGNENAEAVIAASQEVGIRLVLARAMYDWEGAPRKYIEKVEDSSRRCRELMEKYQGHPMVSIHPAPHSPHGASPAMIKEGAALARSLGTPFHIHVAEGKYEVEMTREHHGATPMRYLDGLGVVGPEMLAVHCCWLDEGELELMAEMGASLLYNPSSNMFLGDGLTRIRDLKRLGVRIALGTDGACSNNQVSVFGEMRMTALLQKVVHLDSTALTAKEAFHMGTRGGGEALGLPVGLIAPGYEADLVVLDTRDLSLQPLQNLKNNIVYSMTQRAIRAVVVGGREVCAGGELKLLPEEEILRQVRRVTGEWRRED